MLLILNGLLSAPCVKILALPTDGFGAAGVGYTCLDSWTLLDPAPSCATAAGLQGWATKTRQTDSEGAR